MNQTLIQRYQPGGDIYASLLASYGVTVANNVAAAARTGDATRVNAVMPGISSGIVATPLNDSTASIFWDQITTDPLAAPLESANNQIGKAVLNFLKNPWVLAAGVAILFFAFGGAGWIRKKLAK